MSSQLAKLDIDATARRLSEEHYLGVVRLHKPFPLADFTRFVDDAIGEVTILQTWIPNLEQLEDAQVLRKAIERGVQVRILLVHPSSPVALLREEALRSVRDPAREVDVKAGVRQSLSILKTLHDGLQDEDRSRLQVRVYNALPSIAVYKADEHYLVSSFLHGQLAIASAQIEIDGSDTVTGAEIQRELDTLWNIGREVDLRDWRRSIDAINL